MSNEKISIALDMGYSSIGWSVSQGEYETLKILGCGTVIFEPDRCLASESRRHRRTRRNIRATRVRIERMKAFLLKQGVITSEIANIRHPHPEPWRLATNVLRDGRILTAKELWAVLLWYAHNRGYDGNRLWSARLEESSEDTERVNAARGAMTSHTKTSMAETVLDIVTDGKPDAPALKSYKALNLAFPREVVVKELLSILRTHEGKIQGLTAEVVALLMADPVDAPTLLHGNEGIPKCYLGGFLFGQKKPRFDNRLPTQCPISGLKTPSKSSDAFLAFRWAEFLSRVRVGNDREMRPLTPEERKKLDLHVQKFGHYSMGDFKKDVRAETACEIDNLNALFEVIESDKPTIRFPGLAKLDMIIGIEAFREDEATQTKLRRMSHALLKGKTLSFNDLLPLLKESEIERVTEKWSPSGTIKAEIPSGRAPYSTKVMRQAVEEIFTGKEPRAEGGILYRDATKEDPLKEENIDKATNNHLVRHRTKILLRLLQDITREYAENNPARIEDIFLEVARDIKDFSGKKQKEITKEIASMRKSHLDAVKRIAEDLGCDPVAVSAGMARKLRIAKDLDFKCPYTGKRFDVADIRSKVVDLDHILPRSQRATDAMDALVLTFSSVNKLKGARTALQFIQECGGQTIVNKGRDGQTQALQLHYENGYKAFVNAIKINGLAPKKERDIAKRRVRNLLRKSVKEADEMTEGMLTQTSAIMKLATRAIKGWFVQHKCKPIQPTLSPGFVTKEVRAQWGLLEMLAQFDVRLSKTFTNLDGNIVTKVIPKGEMRKLTHMHHAVDAIAILLAGKFISPQNRVWSLMRKRHCSDEEKMFLLANGPFYWNSHGERKLKDLPSCTEKSIRHALGELRTVRYASKRLGRTTLEETQWRVVDVKDGRVSIRQHTPDGYKTGEIAESAAFGLHPKNGEGKLKRNKAIYVGDTNYAIALANPPVILRERFVWRELQKLAQKNNGKTPTLLRKGDIIEMPTGDIKGIWMIRSIKDSKGRLLLDLTPPYNAEGAKNGVPYWKINQLLSSLLKCNMRIPHHTLTGVPACPITSLKSPASKKPKSTAKTDNSTAK